MYTTTWSLSFHRFEEGERVLEDHRMLPVLLLLCVLLLSVELTAARVFFPTLVVVESNLLMNRRCEVHTHSSSCDGKSETK